MSPLPSVTTLGGAGAPVGRRSVRRARRFGVAVMGVAGLVAGVLVPSALGAAGDTGGTWRLLPAAPIDLAGVSTGVWTGREVLFGVPNVGVRLASAYSPATNTWRRLPGGPAPAQGLEGRDRSVWTGREWLITGWGPRIAYTPATDTWRKLPTGPFVLPSPVVVWTGSQMIEWGGGCCAEFGANGAAYRPSTNTWRKLPTSPLAGRQSAAGAWTGKEIMILGGFTERTLPDGVTRGVIFRDAAAYDPVARAWRRLPSMPAARTDATAVWDGRDVLVVGGRKPATRGSGLAAGVFAYRPSTNRWRLLRPMPRGRAGLAAVWTGSRLLVWGGTVERGGASVAPQTTLSFNPTANAWTVLAPSPVAGRTTRRPSGRGGR